MLENLQDAELEIREIALYDAPHDFVVDTEVLMDDHVAETGGLRPDFFRVSRAELGGQRAASFADDHQVMHHPGLDQFVLTYRGTATRSILLDALMASRRF